MAGPMEVSLPQTMLQKLLDLLKLESFHPHQEIAIQSIIQDQKDAVDLRTYIQHESAALIGLFHSTSSVLPSVESYRNYQKPTQRGVQGYISSLQRRVPPGKRRQFYRDMFFHVVRKSKFHSMDL